MSSISKYLTDMSNEWIGKIKMVKKYRVTITELHEGCDYNLNILINFIFIFRIWQYSIPWNKMFCCNEQKLVFTEFKKKKHDYKTKKYYSHVNMILSCQINFFVRQCVCTCVWWVGGGGSLWKIIWLTLLNPVSTETEGMLLSCPLKLPSLENLTTTCLPQIALSFWSGDV